MDNEQVRIGKIVGCHGIRGDLKVRPASDPDWVDDLEQVNLQLGNSQALQTYRIKNAWQHGQLVLVHLEGVDTRNAAELLINATLFAKREDLPAPQEGQFWVDQLLGLNVIDVQTGRKRGIVKDLLSSSGQDYLEIQLEDSDQTAIVYPNNNNFNNASGVYHRGTFLAQSVHDFTIANLTVNNTTPQNGTRA